MRLIAHRGFAATAPENTVLAIRRAATVADAIEFDVRRCGSGELVVLHDETVDRVTDGAGRLGELTRTDLERLTVLGSGEPIPTLQEALDPIPPDVDVNLEVKELGLADDVLAALEDVESHVVVTSFLPDELRRIHELDPEQSTGLLASRSLDAPVTTAVELGCDVIGATYWRCLLTPFVRRAHAVDLEVHAWTIERPIQARLLALRGVDCVSSDRPIVV